MPRTSRWVALAGALLLPLSACDTDTSGASLRLALDADDCARFCASTVTAELFAKDSPLPLGPARFAECGDPLLFASLPAGLQVHAEVRVANLFGETILMGESDLITVVADGLIDLAVPLTATRRPVLVDVGPDPVVAIDAPTTLTLTGAGFEPQAGDTAVRLDDAPLEVASWSDDTVTITLMPGQRGDAITVERCGVTSASAAIRVVASAQPGATPIGLAPGCTGRRFVDATSDPDGSVIVAGQCDTETSGYLQRLSPDADNCAYLGGESWSLSANPAAVALAGARIWAALGDDPRLAYIDGLSAAYINLADDPGATDVAGLSDGRAYAVTSAGRLLIADTGGALAVEGVSATLDVRAVDALDDRAFAVASEGGAGKLVELLPAGGTAEYSLSGCATPTSVAVGPAPPWVAVGCAEGPVLLYDPVDKRTLTWAIPTGSAPVAVVFDALGDVVIAANDAGLHAAQFSRDDGVRFLVTWSATDALPLARLATDHRLFVTEDAGETLAIATPYAEGPLCGVSP